MSCREPFENCFEIQKMLEGAVDELGEAVTIKYVASATAGNPQQGIGNTYTFTYKSTKAVIEGLTQNDVLFVGGIYQIGDIKVQMKEVLREVVYTVGNIGDRLIWNGTEYRVLGKRLPETLQGITYLNFYTMRPVNQI